MEDIGYQIALNQQELKNVIKEYPHKEVWSINKKCGEELTILQLISIFK